MPARPVRTHYWKPLKGTEPPERFCRLCGAHQTRGARTHGLVWFPQVFQCKGLFPVDKLDELQAVCNDGRGVSVVRDAVGLLLAGKPHQARHLLTMWDHDKIRQYPAIHDLIRWQWSCCSKWADVEPDAAPDDAPGGDLL